MSEAPQLAEAARAAAKQGNLALAEAQYKELAHFPAYQAEAYAFFAYHSFLEERYEEACEFSGRALVSRKDDQSKLNLAFAQIGAKRYAAAAQTLASLANGETAFAHLARFAICEQESRESAKAFEAFLRLQGSPTKLASLPPLLARLIANGQNQRASTLRGIHEQLLHTLTVAHGHTALKRIRDSVEHLHGKTHPWQHPQQRPSFFYIPGLEPQPWFERSRFPWIQPLEANHKAIFAEYQSLVAQQSNRLKPYVTADQNAPRQSWGHLIETNNWLSLHLLKKGKPVEPQSSQMPLTMAAIQACDLPDCQGNAPEAFFSTLAPKTHIPPHYGLANFKVVVHLALRIPDDCGIRVGGESRSWRAGECCIFDDSFLHEAWNQSSEHRTVLIFDAWHPDLSELERQAISLLFPSIDAFFNNHLSAQR